MNQIPTIPKHSISKLLPAQAGTEEQVHTCWRRLQVYTTYGGGG